MKSVFSAPLAIICNTDASTTCGLCSAVCTTGKITGEKRKTPAISETTLCISCGHWIAVCPANALSTRHPGIYLTKKHRSIPLEDER